MGKTLPAAGNSTYADWSARRVVFEFDWLQGASRERFTPVPHPAEFVRQPRLWAVHMQLDVAAGQRATRTASFHQHRVIGVRYIKHVDGECVGGAWLAVVAH